MFYSYLYIVVYFVNNNLSIVKMCFLYSCIKIWNVKYVVNELMLIEYIII